MIIHLFEDAQKITVEEEVCECGAQTVTVEYKPEKTKLPKEATEMNGCIFCSEDFSKLIDKHKAMASRPARPFKGGKVISKGRGRGKPKQPKDKMAQLAAYFV